MLENIIKVIAENAAEKATKFIDHMHDNIRTIGDLRKDSFAKSYTTPKQLDRLLAMDDEEQIPSADFEKIIAKHGKAIQKKQAAVIDKLYASGGFAAPKDVCINITWKRNNTWGWNPHAECVVDYRSSTYGTASGCGYDKTSAAIAEALNASNPVMTALYNFVNEGGYVYGINSPEKYKWICAPYFEGGCGVNTIITAFQAMGYECRDHSTYNRRGNIESRYIHFWKA